MLQKEKRQAHLNFPGKIAREWQLIILLAVAKLLVHLVTMHNYELHRDAYLYYANGQHLAWGYSSIPPLIGVIAHLATFLFGNTVFALRIFPAMIGVANIVIIGMAVKELGGKKMAIALAGLAYLLSPAYLHTNLLFQPVSFNQFFWLLSSFFILKMIHRNDPRMWIWIGIAFGLGFLNKYSIVFFYAAFGLALLLSQHRKLIWTKQFLYAVLVGFVIILPNLLWQYQHHWPVLLHMQELRESQLVHVQLFGFLVDQLMMNAQALLIWLGAIIVLLFVKPEKSFRLFGFTFLFVTLLLMLGSGKSYYSLGIYPILFVFGGYFAEKYIRKFRLVVFSFLVVWMFVALYGSLYVDGMPFISFEKAFKKGDYRWEDGRKHDLPQDMADMTGWKELAQKVDSIYMHLNPDERQNCGIFCDNYGQAGAVLFYGKRDHLPQPISLNDSFLTWAPDSLNNKNFIWLYSSLTSGFNPDTFLPQHFGKVMLKATINNPYFREDGSEIYYCQHPTKELKALYVSRVNEERDQYKK